ncbi:hypothetical protein CCHL11_02133 [Colletotrichum chlorophyti]|uniref:DUF427 domain-containing protein n=1 Tax=Colletotrichum chlorophyti TaxID=708187 RepID=A0A1Q8S737_9PEZI|nr:hypothetical protein CCHL11_02133 [Colletotrichum chlorophyti]
MSKPGQFRADLPELARYLLTDGPRRTQPTSRRVRVIFGHSYIVDTIAAIHVWEHEAYPQYYVPISELQGCSWKDKESIRLKGTSSVTEAAVIEITVTGKDGAGNFATDRALRFADDDSVVGPLRGLVRLEFGSMDQWLEEDTLIYVHPKDPYKRIDILPSTRDVRVEVAGVKVAQSGFAAHLLETGLPTRYYLPLSSVDQSILRKSDLVTKCPYKGDAEYFHIVVNGKEHENLVWYYRHPTQESAGIAGLLCFYNEKVDIFLEGKRLDRPKTLFS